MSLAAPIADLAISEADIAAYHRDGGVVLRGLLDARALALLETGIEEARAAGDRRQSVVHAPDGTGITRVAQYPTQSSPALARLVASGLVGQIAARMMRTPSAQLVLDQIFHKAAGPIAPTPWHQDTPFLRVRGHDLTRLWMCCDPSPRQLTVEIVRGSHRWNVVYNTRTEAQSPVVTSELSADFSHDNLGDAHLPLVPDVAAHRDSFDIIGWDVAPGDVLVFHGNVLHGAGGSHEPVGPRRALASLWGGPALRYHRPEGKAFPPPGGEDPERPIPHGDPIGLHPQAFPFGWQG